MSDESKAHKRHRKTVAALEIEAVARALNLEAGRQRGLATEDDWDTLTEQERGGWRLCARAALEAAPVARAVPQDDLQQFIDEFAANHSDSKVHYTLNSIAQEFGLRKVVNPWT